jgi:Fe-S oxidoreductase
VRPVLNLRLDKDLKAMRAIAEEAFAMVREYKGSHSGEHGDGIVRSEFHEAMFGPRLTRAFEEVKDLFDPKGLFNPGRIVRSEFHEFMFGKRLVHAFEEVKDRFDPAGLYNPGKIVRAPKFDDRTNFRYGQDYHADEMTTRLDWSAYTGAGGGFQGAVEMCNNNGACRASAGGVMCPSYRVTREERDVTRGRANSLRLAITGQLGPDALTSDEMAQSLKLCVSCKGCKRECPTGVDMARMKIEVLAARAEKFGLSLRDRFVGYLPRYAPIAAKLPWLLNLRDLLPGAAKISEAIAGLSARRSLPKWRSDIFRDRPENSGEREVVLFADTFNRYFERENLDAAYKVLAAAGYKVHCVKATDGSNRPLCCGRTFFSIGKVEEARKEAERSIAALLPFVERGVPVVGLEPSCILGFRDEIPALLKNDAAKKLAAHALTFEEFLLREHEAGRPKLSLSETKARALVHGHCHQKAFDAFSPVTKILKLVPGLAVEPIESSCCGMAGAFGFGAETIDVSLEMGELSLLPAVRAATADDLIVADGTSCRHQIKDGAGREAVHVARVLAERLVAPQQ